MEIFWIKDSSVSLPDPGRVHETLLFLHSIQGYHQAQLTARPTTKIRTAKKGRICLATFAGGRLIFRPDPEPDLPSDR